MRIIKFLGLCVFLLVMLFRLDVWAEEYNIGIMMWKTASTYNENNDGLQIGLKELGFKINQEKINADGNKEKAVEIFNKFINDKKDLIVAFGSYGAKLGYKNVKDIPLIVLGVNTPIAYGITETPEHPGGNITGSSYYISPKKQLMYYKKILPKLKKLGIVYNPKNGASIAEIPATREVCNELEIELIESEIVREMKDNHLEGYDSFVKKIHPAVNKLVGKVDAILVPTNSEIYDNIKYVLEVTIPNKIPVFSYSKKGVEKGALAGMTADNRKLGYKTAYLIKRILKDKENPGDIGFIFDKTPDRIVNIKAAKKIGFAFPIYAIKAASEVIK